MNNISVSIFEDCVNNNQSYWKEIEGKNIILLVEKYAFVSTFDIRVLNKNGNSVIEWYQHLGPFDTYNMINELISPLNN